MCLDVVEQGGLPDAGFTTQHQRSALPVSQIGYEPIESLALHLPAFELKAPNSDRHSQPPPNGRENIRGKARGATNLEQYWTVTS